MSTLQPLSSSSSDGEAVALARIEARAQAEELRLRAIEYYKCWHLAGVCARHKNAPPDGATEWDKCLAGLVAKLGTGFLIALIGVRGNGKSQLATEVVRAACRKGRPAIYTTAMDFFIELRDAIRTGSSERDVLKRHQAPALLVIDEVHERGETPWEDRLLTHLLDRRYADMRDTIMVSNLKRAEFEASTGASIVSRMIEAGGIVECNWGSFRQHSPAPDGAGAGKETHGH